MVSACGSDDSKSPPTLVNAAGPQHIHGLGINPQDGALFIATHTGLFRAPRGSQRSRRVADRWQDTMGFTVTGPNRFLGSGHPDVQDKLPVLLGLIRSEDAGQTWRPVSLLGKADFHVLRSSGRRIYGFDATNERLLVSDTSGRSWARRARPTVLIDLAIDPNDPDHAIATGGQGVFETRDAGRHWELIVKGGGGGLLAWTDAIVLIDGAGMVHRSDDVGKSFEGVGDVGGQPAALAAFRGDLYVALHNNAVKVSHDGGKTWASRLPAG